MEVSDLIHAPANLPMGEEPQYPVNRRLHDAQSWSKCFGEDYISCSCWESNPMFLVVQPIVQSLCQLRRPGSEVLGIGTKILTE